MIFSESVRRNLDPTDQYPDHELWEALRKVQLEKFVADKTEKLDYQLAEQGANLSVGQKQLICLGFYFYFLHRKKQTFRTRCTQKE